MPVSRHALSRRLAITGLLSVGLSACAQSEATVSPFAEPTRADASALGKEPELLVVTTRRSLGARQPYLFLSQVFRRNGSSNYHYDGWNDVP